MRDALVPGDRPAPPEGRTLIGKECKGAGLARSKRDIAEIRKHANVLVAMGKCIATNRFDRWLQQRNAVVDKVNVYWIHTEFMRSFTHYAFPVAVASPLIAPR